MKDAPKRELTDNQKAFLEHLFGDAKGDAKKAREMAGYADSVSPAIIIKSLRNEILEMASDALAGSSAKAVMAMDEVVSNGMLPGAITRMQAAKEILNRVGLGDNSSQNDARSSGSGGLFVLPAKKKVTIEITTSEDEQEEDG